MLYYNTAQIKRNVTDSLQTLTPILLQKVVGHCPTMCAGPGLLVMWNWASRNSPQSWLKSKLASIPDPWHPFLMLKMVLRCWSLATSWLAALWKPCRILRPHLSPFPSIGVGIFVSRFFNTTGGIGLLNICSWLWSSLSGSILQGMFKSGGLSLPAWGWFSTHKMAFSSGSSRILWKWRSRASRLSEDLKGHLETTHYQGCTPSTVWNLIAIALLV